MGNKSLSLFGFYDSGNFGDDLMATIFGLELRSKQIPFKVFKLNVEEFDFNVVNSVEELVSNSFMVVCGGGGFFLQSGRKNFEPYIIELCAACMNYKIPLVMFSAGGDGGSYQEISSPRRKLLETASFITFRNIQDESLLDYIGSEKGSVHADIVWATPSYFPLEKIREPGLTIGLDGGHGKIPWNMLIFIILKVVCFVFRKRYRFVMIRQRNMREKHSDPDLIAYEGNISKFIQGILTLDLVITHRLHVGMVAMSYDIPVIELFPTRKASILFKNLGLNHLVFSNVLTVPKLISTILRTESWRKLSPSRAIKDFSNLSKSSTNHIKKLFTVIDDLYPH